MTEYRGINYGRKFTPEEIEEWRSKFLPKGWEIEKVYYGDNTTLIVVKKS